MPDIHRVVRFLLNGTDARPCRPEEWRKREAFTRHDAPASTRSQRPCMLALHREVTEREGFQLRFTAALPNQFCTQ
jgi:hypothetical protein